MNKSWAGFAAYNKLIKVKWAAMEEQELQVAVETFDLLLGVRARHRAREARKKEAPRKSPPDSLAR